MATYDESDEIQEARAAAESIRLELRELGEAIKNIGQRLTFEPEMVGPREMNELGQRLCKEAEQIPALRNLVNEIWRLD